VIARYLATFSAACVIAGVTIGTGVTTTPTRAPSRVGDYSILAGDFHVHAFPGDGSLAPWPLRDEAAREGLDVFAVTNHNQALTAQFARQQASGSDGPLVLAGEEVTNRDYHLIAVGITRKVNASQPAAGAIGDIHAQGGVAIAAHPGPLAIGYTDDAIRALDGTEAAHPAEDQRERDEFIAFYERARRLNPQIAAIGSSDFHAMPAPVGACRTFLFVRERTEEGLLDAIRNGRTVALDETGQLYGDPALVALAKQSIPHKPADTHAGWRRLSVALAWVGVLGLLMFGGGVR
jgi:predicted metal-dependent phosphoesterase TrpH